MNALKPLMTALMALNWLAAPIAIVWLVILGEWWVIGVAFASLFSHFLLGLALIPGLALIAPAVAAGIRVPSWKWRPTAVLPIFVLVLPRSRAEQLGTQKRLSDALRLRQVIYFC